jgi:HTH domain
VRSRGLPGSSIKVDKECASTYIDTMSQATKLAGAAGDQDPRIGLRSVAALRKLVEQLEALQVRNARGIGWSWQEIADELGVSRQAVHKKHARGRILARRR